MKRTRGRTAPKATVTVYGCSASISLRSLIPASYRISEHQVTVDEAHMLIKAPYVAVNANELGGWPGSTSRKLFETGRSACAVALIDDEAYAAVAKALNTLRRDIAAGPIEKGTHSQYAPRDPLEPAEERELRAFRERVLRELERTA